MNWRSRKEEQQAATAMQNQGGDLVTQGTNMIAKGEGMVSQGKALIKRGKSVEPGKQNWVAYLRNPFSFSEYNSEEITKGAVYMIMAIPIVAVGGLVGSEFTDLSCCSSVGIWVGGFYFLCGVMHASVGSR
jgi:hypothetical protein